MSTCEDGRKASTPIFTTKPPFTLERTRPVITEPSSQVLTIFSQFFFCSALSKESCGFPSRSSNLSRKTSRSDPISRSPKSKNSWAGIVPSALPPKSITTSVGRISMIVPEITEPSLSNSILLSASNSSIIALIAWINI